MKDSENIIIASPPGTAIYALTNRPDPRIDFLVREHSKLINEYSPKTKITIRARFFNRNNVAIILIMFQIGSEASNIFSTFWNYYGENGNLAFSLMSSQDDIAFHLYGESKKIERSILMANSFRNFFKAARKKIETIPPWTLEQFEREKGEILKTYLTYSALWEAIK